MGAGVPRAAVLARTRAGWGPRGRRPRSPAVVRRAHTMALGRVGTRPPAGPGRLGGRAWCAVAVRAKFLPGARVKAPAEQSGGGTWGRPRAERGRAHEEPAGGRASGVGGRPRNFVRSRAGAGTRGPRGSGATRALRVGFCVPPRGQLHLVRGGPPLAPPVSPSPARSRLAPATAWSRDGALAGERGAGGLGGLGRSGGPAAMFLLRGGPRRARRGRGTWRRLRAARRRLFPAQASGRVQRARRTDPLPLGVPIGGPRGAQRTAGVSGALLRPGLAAARRAAAQERAGGGTRRVRL